VLGELLLETKEGIKISRAEGRIIKQAVVMLTLQPATDQFYDPVIPGLLKYSKWRTITRVVSSCLRWKNKERER
jgi:hypothetical protein